MTLIINVGNSDCYQNLDTAIEPPYWAIMAGSWIEGLGNKAKIVDLNLEELKYLEKWKSDKFVVLAHGHHPSASTQLMDTTKKVVEDLRGFGKPIYVGGGHAEALRVAELGVDGLWKDYGDICLQGLHWGLVGDYRRYRAHNWHCFGGLDRYGYGVVHSSFGCPYACSYCCVGGNGVKYRPPSLVLEDIDGLVKAGVKNLKIADEIFFLKKTHYTPILEGLVKRRYGLNIWCYARPDVLDTKCLALAKKAGINWLALGIEDSKDKKGRNIREVVAAIRKAKINVIGNYMFGLPNETFESMQATFDLASELNCEYANFYCVMAYPGSKLYAEALKKGYDLPSSWSGYGQYSLDTLPLSTPSLTARDILTFRDNAFHSYFTSPKYLGMIKKKFGNGTVKEIQRMTTVRLRRANGVE